MALSSAETTADPTDRCRWVPFPCLFSLPAFEKYVQEKFPSQGPQSNDASSSLKSNADTAATTTLDATVAMPPTESSPPTPVVASACVAVVSPATSIVSRPAAATDAPPSSVAAAPTSAPAQALSSVSSASPQFSSLSSVVSYLSQRYFLFVAPVNPKHFPGYSKVVKNPMSLQVITNKFVFVYILFLLDVHLVCAHWKLGLLNRALLMMRVRCGRTSSLCATIVGNIGQTKVCNTLLLRFRLQSIVTF